MTRPRRDRRLLATCAGVVALLALASALPPRGLGQAPNKGDVDLLTAPPFDRITLVDGSVVKVEPVLPRPLPPYDSEKEARRKRIARGEIPEEGNIPLPGQKARVELPRDGDDEDDPSTLTVHLLEGDTRDFKLKRPNIKSIDYYEDMLMAEAERLIPPREFARAFECLLRAKTRTPGWRGLDDQVNRLLFAEGNAALLDNDGERGLRLLGELFARKPDFPGLADKLATSYGGRANRAFELGMYAKGRKILHDAEPMTPGHAYLAQVRARYVDRARDLVRASSKANGAARLDLLTEALRVWPTTEGGEAAYREAFAAAPTLDVATDDVSRRPGPWCRSPADARVTPLLYLPVLARDDEDARQGKGVGEPGQLATEVTTTDLGRRVVIRLRPGVPWSDGTRTAGAIDVERMLTDAAEPSSPRYSARWADLLDRVQVADPTRVDVRLTRVCLRPGAWLLGPVGPAHAAADGRASSIGHGRELVGDGPYRWAASGPDRIELVAAEPASGGDGHPAPRVRRIKESRFAGPSQTFGAFARGDVALVEHVPPDRLAALAENPAVKVGRYARPRVHAIAVDGRTPTLHNRNLRRALSLAVDRRLLLEDVLLRRPADETSRVSDGPFPRGTYADSADVKPLAFDPVLARMLFAAARKELGNQPIKLRLEYPAVAEAQALAPRIVEAWNLAGGPVGVVVTGTERPESELEGDLRAGRRFDLAYRAMTVDEPVRDAGPLIAPAYDAPPARNPLASVSSPRILQLLLQLERASDWPSARGLVLQIDRESRDELPAIPLWQVEDHYAWQHTRLRGPKEVCERLYEGIASWEVDPWFARDPW